ncbi:HNH endonuclease signature motif containing protein [Streptomyces sp. NPDC051162]|uniref:HNH endonuclease n=1 Tax=Streptomyces sp. NPDC051162 TaxID=3154747 RepID=UPI00342CED6B
MDTRTLASWINVAQKAFNYPWETSPIHALARESVPQHAHGPLGWLLKSDINSTWALWYINGIVDTAAYEIDTRLSYAHFYREVRDALQEDHRGTPWDEISHLAKVVAQTAWPEIEFRRSIHRRKLTKKERSEIWSSQPNPRCYLCGYLFTAAARDRFLWVPDAPQVTPPIAVDFVRPRGLRSGDLLPQVDHIRPVAIGGETSMDNLRLACGWCNRKKSSHIDLYGTPSAYAGTFDHPNMGRISVPRPLWVVRLVKMRGRCEDYSGCKANIDNAELFVAPRRLSGAINPTNCAVYCDSHDPWRNQRFVGAKTYAQNFQKSRF